MDWLKEYGSAIGPGVAFLLGLLTLFLKDVIERKLRRTRSRHLFKQFKKLALAYKPPELIPVPPEGGHATGDANRGNHLSLRGYHYRLLAARAFLDANEKIIAEASTFELLQSFYEFKWRFIQLADFVNSCTELKRPINEGDLMQVNGFHYSLEKQAEA